MILWQWEQGRGEYFQFENILAMSRILLTKEGMPVSDLSADKLLRDEAFHAAGLKFLPHKRGYTVWRNYARVFKAMMLATDVPDRSGKRVLKCTDLCAHLAAGEISAATDYVSRVMKRFYLSGPVFGAKNYRPDGKRVFPFCAIVRFLAARTIAAGAPGCASPDEIKDFLFAREIAGDEDVDFFREIDAAPTRWKSADQRRQIREMLIFSGQCSFLKWDGRKLCMDLPHDSLARHAKTIFNRMSPDIRRQERTAHEEIINMGKIDRSGLRLISPSEFGAFIGNDPMADDLPREGKRRVVNHIVIERSPKLREMFFTARKRAVCDITGAPRHAGFPWVENILEIHHVTPLSSSVSSGDQGTSLDDLVALTPTSHRAVHDYYRRWLRENKRDFKDKREAREVYRAAKTAYLQSGGIKRWA